MKPAPLKGSSAPRRSLRSGTSSGCCWRVRQDRCNVRRGAPALSTNPPAKGSAHIGVEIQHKDPFLSGPDLAP